MKKILLIYTGGTIGMQENPHNGALEAVDFDKTLHLLRELSLMDVNVDVEKFTLPIDSSDMGPDRWRDIVDIIADHYSLYDGFVILHGTDTMAYTASALSFMLEGLNKPVVLTGSQLPIGKRRTDGNENLITAIEIAAATTLEGAPRVPEVCICFHDKLLRGNRTTKSSADAFDAFCSFNYPELASIAIDINYFPQRILPYRADATLVSHRNMDCNMLVLSLFPGIKESTVRTMLETPGLKGVVMRTFGSGNAPTSHWLTLLLKEYVDRGLVIVNITQCAGGNVVMNRYETGLHLQNIGVISGHDSTVEAALTKLMRLFGDGLSAGEVKKMMQISLAGEI